MKRRDGWTEGLLRWAVGDDEAAEGLLGDLQEEWAERRGREPEGLRYRLALLALSVRYLFARSRGRVGPDGAPDGVGRELGFALRSLARAPGFSSAFLATLALGLGATLTVFTVLDSVVLRPLAYDDAGELVRLQSAVPGMGPDTRWNLAKAQYLYLRDETAAASSMGIYYLGVSSVGDADRPDVQAQRISTANVNADVFTTLRIVPAMGRPFNVEESLEQSTSVVILSDGYWHRQFGGDPDVLGSRILVDGRALEIVGVLPPDAALPEEAEVSDLDVDLWMPMYISPSERPVNSHGYRSVARLAPGAGVEGLNTELRRLSATLPEVIPQAYSPQFMEDYGFFTMATPLHGAVVGDISNTLWIVFGAVGLLLLVACFNAANLLLARTQRRSRELAIRSALGAGRGTLGRQLLLESMVLCALAGTAAVGLAWLGADVLVRLAPEGLPRLDAVGLSATSVAVAAAASLALGAFFGVLPVVGRGEPTKVLGDASRGNTASRSHHAARRVLVVAQLAVSLVLLAGATLLFQSYRNLSRVETGIQPDDVLTFRVILPAENYADYASAGAFYRQATDDLQGMPGVLVAGAINALPLDGYNGCSIAYPENYQAVEGESPPCLPVMLVTPGYFEAMGMAVRGTPPTWAAVDEQRLEVMVSERFAARFFGDDDPMGRGVSAFGTPHKPVQAVVGDVRGAGLREPAWQAVYMSIIPDDSGQVRYWPVPRFLHFAVRTDGTAPATLIAAVRETIAGVDPRVPMSDIRPMADVVAQSTARDSFIALLLGVASALSLMLSALGVYAVISYIVQGRRGEIGVRLALGAERAQVRGLVVGQSVRLAVLGVVLGLALALPVSRVLQSFLYEMSPTDPLTLIAASVALILVAALASFAPALRATRVDPVEALRAE